ncbi:MAG: hypothetical protein MUF06_24285 [Pirellulaceae bacterium]|nr:hypothetical protein [Pirellulaceae bacterium]
MLRCAVALGGVLLGVLAASAKDGADDPGQDQVTWLDNYRVGMDQAKTDHRLALVWFGGETESSDHHIERLVREHQPIAEKLQTAFVAIRVPLATLREQEEGEDGPAVRLVDHPAFAELRGQAGLAIVDYREEASPHYGMVVSVYPFAEGPLSAGDLAVLLDLPAGSLTSRTLVFALRTHPDRPESTSTSDHPILAAEAARHATHQARIRLQGHHGWEHRFHAINARLPAGHVANEVCAESWPGQTLVAAARECVASWRQSSGHWNHVSRPAAYFGFDMQRGTNGTWYAAGIVAHRHHP